MDYRLIAANLVAFFVTVVIIVLLIYYQKKKAIGQIERELGPKSHKIKQGTPTLGGIGFLLGSLVGVVLLLVISPYYYQTATLILLFIPFFSYGLLGFIDDYLILKRGKNDGLKAKTKFIIQLFIAGVIFYLYLIFNRPTTINLGFMIFDIKWGYGVLILLLFSGFSNATNLTDGLDGLLGGLMVLSLICFYVLASWVKQKEVAEYLFIITATLLAFLMFNYQNAKIYMGNTGALALGALFASIGIVLKLEVFLFSIGVVYVLETASVMLQVGYFKMTKGKRLFRMAPLHHHFELKPMREKDCVYLMYFIGVIGAILSLVWFFYGGF